ncbi:MFS transporter [Sphaerisporangium sp. TRM90804]|uniref:MFS transporter n=1 Tax=Sphaerisporangium sp. TRM90804 TaxID=3031113 RepID=UPI00244B75B1|nr:MFS transporter [Sphaerisporangium sp. TRM90804]MDH2424558.1 MFS transporter [Sphaerisporangium sp. TRM90804]
MSRPPAPAAATPPPAPAERRRPGGLLRQRDFRMLWIGETTSAFGSTLTGVALPLVAVTTLGAGTFTVALLTAATWLPWLVVGLPAGAWIDRLPRRPVMLACDLASLLLLLSVPVAAWIGMLTITHLLAVALLAGVSTVFFQTAYHVYLPTVVDAADLPEANAKLQGSESAAQVAGPGAAGLAAQALGAVSGLLADAATFLVSALCLMAVKAREKPVERARRATSLRTEIGAGLRFVVRDPYLRVLTAFGAASNLALTGYQAILVVFLVREVGVGPGVVGGLIAATGLGGVAGAALAPWIGRRLGTARALLTCLLCGSPAGLLIPLARPGAGLAFMVAGGLVVSAAVVAGNVIKGSFRQVYCPRPMLGRITVSMQFLNYGTIPLGALLGGTLGTALGTRPTMWIMTGMAAVSALVLLAGPIRRHRDLPAAPPGHGHEPAGAR